MRLEWSPLAIEDRFAIFEFPEAESPSASVRTDEAIRIQTRRLIAFPQSGRPGRIMGTRELVVRGLPYVVAYQVKADAVRILRVLHGSQEWPNELSL